MFIPKFQWCGLRMDKGFDLSWLFSPRTHWSYRNDGRPRSTRWSRLVFSSFSASQDRLLHNPKLMAAGVSGVGNEVWPPVARLHKVGVASCIFSDQCIYPGNSSPALNYEEAVIHWCLRWPMGNEYVRLRVALAPGMARTFSPPLTSGENAS